MPVTYPNESAAYRSARDALLQAEIALRSHSAQVAKLRGNLPNGGSVNKDHRFTAQSGEKVKLSALFTKGSNTLAIYSLMHGPEANTACPMCVSLLDGLDGQATHFGQRMDFVVVSAARPGILSQLAADRGWSNLTLLSASGGTYQSDYHGETPDGAQVPMINIFRKQPSGISHHWGSESFFAEIEGHPRHLDQIWPLWNMLDLTPDGRGEDWYPSLDYGR